MDERLLRSVMQVGDVPEAEEALRNWIALSQSNLEAGSESDAKIVGYLRQFYGGMSHPPAWELVKEYFEKDDAIDAVDRLGEVKAAQPYTRTNFLAIMRSQQQSQELRGFVRLMRDAAQIAEQGRNLEKPIIDADGKTKKVLRGVTDAWAYVTEKIGAIEATREPPMATAEDVFAPLPQIDWLCEGLRLARTGGAVLFAGYGYSGKSIFAQALALAVAAGASVGERYPCRRGPIVHLDWEQGQYMTNLRYQRLSLGMGIHPQRGGIAAFGGALAVQSFPSLRLDQAGAEDRLRKIMEGRRLLIVDSLRAACPSLDENSSEIRRPLDMLNALADKTGCVPIVIHHAKKQEGMTSDLRTVVRGSSAIFDAAASVYVFTAREGEPVLVSHVKERFGRPVRPFRLLFEGNDDDGPLRVSVTPDGEFGESVELARDREIQDQIIAALREHPGCPSVDALRAHVRAKKERVVETVRILVGQRRVERRKDGYHVLEPHSPADLIQ
jgi:hypothetical protein